MWQRFCLCCQYTCRSGTRTIDLIKKLLLILLSLVVSYFTFMFIGYAEYVSGFPWEMKWHPCGSVPSLFHMCILQGFITVGILVLCFTFLGLFVIGLYKLFKDPCMEIKDNWDRAEYPDYGTLETNTKIEVVVNTTANEINE